MPGHPDGQNYAIWRGPYFAASPTTHIDSTHPFHAEGQVTNYASLILDVLPSITGGINVLVHWWVDSTKTQQLAQNAWIVPNSVTLSVIIPCMTNFVSIDITTADVAGGNCETHMAPTNTPVERDQYQVTGNALTALGLNVGAGATVTFALPYIAAGRGYVYMADILASTHLDGRVVVLDINGAVKADLVRWPTLVNFQAQLFDADAQALAIFVHNNDGAAAHPVDYYLTVSTR